MFLSAALAVTQLPAVAMAENAAPEDGSIASFKALDSRVAAQTVAVGTAYDQLNLPDKVTAAVYHVSEGVEGKDSGQLSPASPSDAASVTITTSDEKIPVTWDSDPAYDGDVANSYVFTADVGSYALSSGAKLPQITVTVTGENMENGAKKPLREPLSCAKTEGCTLADGHEGECVPAPPTNDALVKTVTGWTFVDDENLNEGELALPGVSAEQQLDFDTVVSMLPTRISAEVEGEADKVPVDIIGWSCPQYKQDGGSWPLTGEYTFTAAIPSNYSCEPPPTVQVIMESVSLLANSPVRWNGDSDRIASDLTGGGGG